MDKYPKTHATSIRNKTRASAHIPIRVSNRKVAYKIHEDIVKCGFYGSKIAPHPDIHRTNSHVEDFS